HHPPHSFPTRRSSDLFARSWQLNGGQDADQAALTDEHLAWLRGLPVLARIDDYLLMHSDTVEYFGWGDSLDEINDAVHDVLAGRSEEHRLNSSHLVIS